MTYRIVLVNPNQMKPAVAPIGVDYLACSLRVAGFRADVLDLCFAEDLNAALDGYFHDHAVDAVGFSIRNTDDCYYTGQAFFLPDYKAMIDAIRQRTTAPIILGGVGFSIMPRGILEYCQADLGIVGDGEWALPSLLHRLAQGEPYGDLPGLVYRAAAGIALNPPAAEDLDTLPSLRRGAIDNARYLCQGGMGGLETKRGCPGNCIYCADPVAKGHTSRLRSPARVADEVEQLLSLGVDWLHTCDSEFNIPGHHAAAVCQELIDRGLGDRVQWYAYCAPRPFSRDLARLMRRAGCVGIDFGADSGDDAMLGRLARDHTSDDLTEVARICHTESIPFMYDLLLGGPGETRDTVGWTIDLMRQIRPSRVGVALGVRIYPGTPLAHMLGQQVLSSVNPHLRGTIAGNPGLLAPVFYVSADLGPDPVGLVSQLVGQDERFFFGGAEAEETDYNYNENDVLVQAIQEGYRGAFWDILRRLQEEGRWAANPG